MTDTVKVNIDGQEIEVPKGMNVIEAAKKVGVEIPHYCYHSHLSVAGNCRMCTVEIEGMRGLPIACNTGCTDGMVVHTDTEKVKDTRAAVLEFLLLNHPIDCPICDQAGECMLQIYYMEHDRQDSRVALEEKVHKGKAIEVGPRVMLDQERCIACARCVRFCDEITKTGELRLLNRSNHTTIDTFPGIELDNDYSVCTADICPVGALTNKDFRFKARVWFLQHDDEICPGCATGCNVVLDHYEQIELEDWNGVAYRLRPRINDDVNQAWMCDHGRLEYHKVNDDRLDRPIAHNVEVSWEGALTNLRKVLTPLADEKGAVAGIASYDCTNEEIWLFKKLLKEAFGTEEVALIPQRADGPEDDFLIDADKHPNRAGCQLVAGDDLIEGEAVADYLEGRKAVIVLDADPRSAVQAASLRDAYSAVKQKIILTPAKNASVFDASFVLPTVSFAEKDGTWVNRQGRVQRIRRAIRRSTAAKPALDVLAELAALAGLQWGEDEREAAAVFEEIAKDHPRFRGLDYDVIGRLGAPLEDRSAMAKEGGTV